MFKTPANMKYLIGVTRIYGEDRKTGGGDKDAIALFSVFDINSEESPCVRSYKSFTIFAVTTPIPTSGSSPSPEGCFILS